MEIAVLGMGLGKTAAVWSVWTAPDRSFMRRRMQRDSVIQFSCGMAPCVVAMEAC
jgi:hypothetical protein